MPFDSASDDAFDSPSLATLGWDASRVAELASLSSARGVELDAGSRCARRPWRVDGSRRFRSDAGTPVGPAIRSGFHRPG